MRAIQGFLLAVLVAGGPLSAQDVTGGQVPAYAIDSAQKVRVRFGPERGQMVVGAWAGIDDRGALLIPAGPGRPDTLVVPLEQLRSLERVTGRGGNGGKGFAIGFGLGGVLGGAAAVAGTSGCEDGFITFCPSPGQAFIGGFVGGGLLGGLVGLAIGATSRSERWEVVPLRPSQGGLGPGVTLRF